MAKENVQRKLAAIFSADVAGYSRLMRDDEVATIETLSEYREVMSSLVVQHRGRVVDTPGDNILAEFTSVVDAVQSAVAVQKELKVRNGKLPETRRMEFRIGINIGDVVQEGDRIYGDGVNIAARLESLAEPGGICISRPAYDQIESKLPLGYEYMGKKIVKNISKPLYAYRVIIEQENHSENKSEHRDGSTSDGGKQRESHGSDDKRYDRSFRDARREARHQFKDEMRQFRDKYRRSGYESAEEKAEKSYRGIKDQLKDFANEMKHDENIAETFQEIKGRFRSFADDMSGSDEQRTQAFHGLFKNRHLRGFLGIAGFLFLINALTSFGKWWFQFPTVSIGLILYLHWFRVSFFSPEKMAVLRQKLIRREKEHMAPELRDSEEGILRAGKKADAQVHFYNHLYIYAGVNAFLIIINLMSSPFKWWFPFPLLAWGIIVFLHWIKLK